VNAPEPYERHLDRTLPEAPPTPEPDKAVEALAVHRDPSLTAATPQAAPDHPRPTVAWVRPSELPTLIGAPWIRRGIDLQTELTRRARRTPRSVATKAGRRISRTAIAHPEAASPTATSIEELGL
jgi:hypothetical protein